MACGFGGHQLVGTDAAELRPEDALLAVDQGRFRWHRCLRCDSWLALPPPESPTRLHPPPRSEIVIPLRGKALRDKVVLRLIAIDRAFHFVVLCLLGIVVLIIAANQKTARGEFERVLAALQGGVVQTRGHVGILGELDKLFSLRSKTLYAVGIALIAYGVLEGIEAVGLWFAKRWAEYLTFIATGAFLPYELSELVSGPSVLKVGATVINLAVLGYLLFSKRLFGVRGGAAEEERIRYSECGWEALERSTPELIAGGAGGGRLRRHR